MNGEEGGKGGKGSNDFVFVSRVVLVVRRRFAGCLYTGSCVLGAVPWALWLVRSCEFVLVPYVSSIVYVAPVMVCCVFCAAFRVLYLVFLDSCALWLLYDLLWHMPCA